MAQLPGSRPLQERDFRDEPRPHPEGVPPEPPRRSTRERAVALLQDPELFAQLPPERARVPRSDLAGEDQAAVLEDSDEEGADPRRISVRLREPPDHEFLPFRALRLQPPRTAARPVRRPALLRDDSLESEPACIAEDLLPAACPVLGVSERRGSVAQELAQSLLPLLDRLGAQIAAIELKQIEDEIREPGARAAAEGRLQRLEARPPVGEQHRRFTIEQEAARADLPGRRRDFRELRRPVVPLPAKEHDRAALPLAADPVPVELHLVKPAVPPGGRLYQGRKLREVLHSCPMAPYFHLLVRRNNADSRRGGGGDGRIERHREGDSPRSRRQGRPAGARSPPCRGTGGDCRRLSQARRRLPELR